MRGGPKGNIGYGNGGGDGSPNGKSSPVLMQLSPRVSGKNWQVNKEPNRAGRVLSAVKEYRGGAMRSNVRRLSFRLLCLRSVHDDLMKKRQRWRICGNRFNAKNKSVTLGPRMHGREQRSCLGHVAIKSGPLLES